MSSASTAAITPPRRAPKHGRRQALASLRLAGEYDSPTPPQEIRTPPPHPAKSAPHHRDFAGAPGPRFPGDPGTGPLPYEDGDVRWRAVPRREHALPGAHRDHGLTRSCGAHFCYAPCLSPSPLVGEGWGGGAERVGTRRAAGVCPTSL